jgi:hypothetical protein
MDPHKGGQDAIQKILFEELVAHSHNSEICDSAADRSDNEYVPSEHSGQEECDHVSTHATDCDGDNVTASDDSVTDSETETVMKQKVDKFGINYPLLRVATGNSL